MKPGEHKTVQARVLECAETIGWTLVSGEDAEQRRGFDPYVPPADRARNRSRFFDDLLDDKVREFNPRYAEAEGVLHGQFRHLHNDDYGNRKFVEHLRDRGKLFDHEEKQRMQGVTLYCIQESISIKTLQLRAELKLLPWPMAPIPVRFAFILPLASATRLPSSWSADVFAVGTEKRHSPIAVGDHLECLPHP